MVRTGRLLLGGLVLYLSVAGLTGKQLVFPTYGDGAGLAMAVGNATPPKPGAVAPRHTRTVLMHRAFVIISTLLQAQKSIPGGAAQKSTASSEKKESEVVYITRTGSKYHRGNCRHLAKSRIPVALDEAISRYGPCSACKPPTKVTGASSPSGAVSRTADTRSPRIAAPSTAPRVSGGQCAATTNKGTRCKRNAKPGSAYCWQHGG